MRQAINPWVVQTARCAVGFGLALSAAAAQPPAPRGAIVCLASEGRSHLYAAARAGEVDVFASDAAAPLQRLTDLGDSVNAVTFSPDGTLLLAGGGEVGRRGRVWVWRIADWHLLKTLEGHSDAIYSLALSASGQTLATGGYDQKIQLWDLASGKPTRQLTQHQGAVLGVDFSPGSNILASASADATLRLWNADTGALLDTRGESRKALTTLAWSPDGRRLAAGGEDRMIRLWTIGPTAAAETNALQAARVVAREAVLRVAFSPDARWLTCTAADATLVTLDAADLAPHAASAAQSDWPSGLAYAGSGNVAIVGRMDGTLSFYDALAAKEIAPPAASGVAPAAAPPVSAPPGATPRAPQALSIPSSVSGSFAWPGAIDRLAFDARKDKPIVFDLSAARIGSRSRVRLSVVDATGAVLASAGPTPGDPDPLLTFTPPRDGPYTLLVCDDSGGGAPQSIYRLTAGDFACITGTFPLSIPANTATRVLLLGQNLPADRYVPVGPAAPGEVELPLDDAAYRTRRRITLLSGDLPEFLRSEAPELAAQPMAIHLPASINARLLHRGDSHLYRFDARRSTHLVFETMAQRRGSPMDTRLAVLFPSGRPVPRVQLRSIFEAVRAGGSIDSTATSVAFTNWRELRPDQYLYLGGEVVRIQSSGSAADPHCLLYSQGGKRQTWFDTTASAHGGGERCYVVEPHDPTEAPPPSPLPTLTLNYQNDDASDRELATDSRLHFTAPADGEYLLRVTEAKGEGGENFVYRLMAQAQNSGQ